MGDSSGGKGRARLRGGDVGDSVLWIVVVYVVADCRGEVVGDDVLWIVVVGVVVDCRKRCIVGGSDVGGSGL